MSMNQHRVKYVSLLVAAVMHVQASAADAQHVHGPQLQVVSDTGGESAIPYYVAISSDNVDESAGYSPDFSRIKPFGFSDMLPVKSSFLTVGRVATHKLNLSPGMTPFFIVGADEVSRRWLEKNVGFLRSINAVGLVTQVNTIHELSALASVAQGIELRPVSADDVAKQVGVRHYPVLIKSDGFFQQ